MAKNVTLASLRTQILQRSDRVGDDPTEGYVTTPELNGYINNSIGEFSDLLFSAMPEAVRKSSTIAVVGTTDTYILPADFKHILGVEFALNGAGGPWLDVRRCQWTERNKYTLRPQVLIPGVVPFEYLPFQDPVSGWSLQLIPSPVSQAALRVWYSPAYTTLEADGDTLDGINGLEEFVIVDCAIKVAQKEETDVSVLMAQKTALISRIQSQGKNRDASEPPHMGWVGATTGWDGGNGWD